MRRRSRSHRMYSTRRSRSQQDRQQEAVNSAFSFLWGQYSWLLYVVVCKTVDAIGAGEHDHEGYGDGVAHRQSGLPKIHPTGRRPI